MSFNLPFRYPCASLRVAQGLRKKKNNVDNGDQ